jgi:hypothetical protein
MCLGWGLGVGCVHTYIYMCNVRWIMCSFCIPFLVCVCVCVSVCAYLYIYM